MTKSLLEQLQLCVPAGTPQSIFAQPPSSLSMFCPHLMEPKVEYPKKRTHDPKEEPNKKIKHDPNKTIPNVRGSIVNKTGKKIYFPKGLTQRYCSDFLDTGTSCKHGENCNFVHAVYPGNIPEEDKKIIVEHVKNTEGLSFVDKKNAS